MLNKVSDRVRSVLIGLLLVQGLGPALAAETNHTLNEPATKDHEELVSRTGDSYQIIHKWPSAEGVASLGVGATLGIVINGAVGNYFAWLGLRPDPEKICGKSKTVSITGDDGVRYKYYAYSYTTGDNCDSTQRAKTLTNALSDAFDDLHSDGASAVCLDFNHGGTWHGVLGVATEASGKDPQDACKDHHKRAKRNQLGFRQLPESAKAKRSEIGLVKRTAISVSQSNKVKESTKFSEPNRSQTVINKLAGEIYEKSVAKSCDPVAGRVTDREGVTYNYYYWASGRNCDTTAEIKTVVSAIDDAWDGMGDLSAVCMTLSHGGTWRGHLGVSAMQSKHPADKLC